MDAASIFTLLIIIAIIAIALSGMAQKRHQAATLLRQRIRHYQMSISELEDIIDGISSVKLDAAILTLFTDAQLNLIKQLANITPNSQQVEQAHNDALARKEKIIEVCDQDKPSITSDNELNNIRTQLLTATRQLQKIHSQGKINKGHLDDYLQQIQWQNIMLEVKSFTHKGEEALKDNNKREAESQFRLAHKTLIQSDMMFKDRALHIQSISKIISELSDNTLEDSLNNDSSESETNMDFGLNNDDEIKRNF